ncbi:hexose transporter protein [Thozetella sp. PMI_491]|nr:hexose transporter protein [Thozetella sp. PMI_491]
MAGDSTHATFEDIPNNTAQFWWKDPSLRLNVFYCLGSLLCPFYLGYDQSLLNGLQALPQWAEYFNSPSGSWLGLISACIFLPGVLLGFPAAWICGTFGRKWCVIVGSVILLAGGVWNALSGNTIQYLVSRVVIGIGGSITKIGAPTLLQESAHPRLRSPLGHMYYGVYFLGALVSAIMCIIGLYIPGEWGWRLPCMVQIIGPLIVLAILIKAPESPRFLVKKGKNAEALQMLARFHANGDVNDPLVVWELREIEYALEKEETDRKSSYLDFFRTRANQKRLLVSTSIAIGCNWVGIGIVSYYLSPVLRTVGVTKPIQLVSINAGLNFWNLIIALTAGINIDKFGRRPLFLISTIGMIICYGFVMGFSAGFTTTGNSNLGIAVIPFLFLFFASYDIAWTPLNYSYVVEIMPFNLRTKGLAIYTLTQNLANAFNQFVNPIALAALTWKYYAVYIAVDCCYVALIYFCYPETKKLSIEEVALVFDYGSHPKDFRGKTQ